LVKDLAEDFDTLTAFSKEAKGNPSGLSHFKHIGKNSELISKSQRELRVFDTVSGDIGAIGRGAEPFLEHERERHIDFVIVEEMRANGVERVTSELVFALHDNEEIELKATDGGNHLIVGIAVSTGRES